MEIYLSLDSHKVHYYRLKLVSYPYVYVNKIYFIVYRLVFWWMMMSRVNVPLSRYFYEVSGEPSGADCSIAALIILFVGPVVRYTERFIPNRVRNIPLNVLEMRKYLANQFFRENYPLVDKANMTGQYIEKSEYVHILI